MMERERMERLGAALRSISDLRFAAIFGSALSAHWRPDSDIDIAVLSRASIPLARELAISVELTLAAGRDVDLVNVEHASTVLKHNIATTGQLLLEYEAGAWAAWRAEALVEYWDFEPLYLQGLRNYQASLQGSRQ